MKYVSNKSDMLTKPHFAIVEFGSIHIPGDERSRNSPGHGYPDHTQSTCTYIAFESEEEWKRVIDKRMTSIYGTKDNFIAIRATPATIKMQTIVKVD
jgi:hypothetical protein